MKKIIHFSLILACNVTLGHAASETALSRSMSFVRGFPEATKRKSRDDEELSISSKKQPRKIPEAKWREIFMRERANGRTSIDSATGAEYCVIKNEEGENICIVRYPGGKIFVWKPYLSGLADIGLASAALEKCLEEEELFEGFNERLMEAIEEGDLDEVKEILQEIPNRKAFLAQFPHFLQEMLSIPRKGNGKVFGKIIEEIKRFAQK